MEKTNENIIEVNRIPSLTWNWMKMNKDMVSIDFSFDSYSPLVSQEDSPDASSLDSKKGLNVYSPSNKNYADVEKLLKERRANFKDEIQTSAGKEISKLIDESTKPVIVTVNGNIEKPLHFTYNNEKDSHTTSSQLIHAFPNSECTIIYEYESKDDEESFAALQTNVYLEEGAKVHIVKVQLLGNEAHQIDDTCFVCADRAQAVFTQIELGGKHVDSGLNVMLSGYQSNFKSHVAYLCVNEQFLDMNHVVLHRGKKTDCNMMVDGTLKDKAYKSYRGTIDFQNGCSGSTGNEMEETLLLTPTVVNKSLPVILCDEEDVEGEHGATLGRLSSDILFYLQTRGIDQKAAEKLMAKAKVQRASSNILDDDFNKKVSEFINERI